MAKKKMLQFSPERSDVLEARIESYSYLNSRPPKVKNKRK
jgi:hypothetical protein